MKKQTRTVLLVSVASLMVLGSGLAFFLRYLPGRAEPKLNALPADIMAIFKNGESMYYQLRRVAEVRNGGTKMVLEFCKHGSEDCDIEQIAGAALLFARDDPFPTLLEFSHSTNAATRAFAAFVMGSLADKRYVRRLEEMKSDFAEVPRLISGQTVAKDAEWSLARIRKRQENPFAWREYRRSLDLWTRTPTPDWLPSGF